jgi:hypothetical protein
MPQLNTGAYFSFSWNGVIVFFITRCWTRAVTYTMNKEEENWRRNGKCDNIKSDTIKNETFTKVEII